MDTKYDWYDPYHRDVTPHNRIDELWYFVVATIVLTAVGIISVLTYLGV